MFRFLSVVRRQAGFSLVEIAIVLGIMGIVLSAVWTTRNIVAEKQKIDAAVVGIHETIENIRALYTGQSGFTYPTTTSAKICAGLYAKSFVLDARNSSGQVTDCSTQSVINPWSGDVKIDFRNADGSSFPHGVGIALTGKNNGPLPTTVCAELADRLAGTSTKASVASGVKNGVPYPLSPPTVQPSQGGQPVLVYISFSHDTWVDATNKSPAWIAQQIQTSCYGVAFYYVF